MSDKETTIEQIKERLRNFVKERDWEQYHSPKSLAMSIAIEAAELMEKFQWLDNKASVDLLEDEEKLKEIEDELADIAIYVLDFCNVAEIDLTTALLEKLKENIEKYPTEQVKGKAHKYTFYNRKKNE